MQFPIRINKYLAERNVATRRGADLLISAGLVKINGRVAKLGEKVLAGDKVEVGKEIQKEYAYPHTKNFGVGVYLAYNKPAGVVTHSSKPQGHPEQSRRVTHSSKPQGHPEQSRRVTHSPQAGEKDIKQVLKLKEGMFPVGRLDKDSSGLIIITNDGRITDKMLNPKFFHEKEYSAAVDRPISNTFLLKIKQGFNIGPSTGAHHYPMRQERVRPAKIRKTGPESFDIILTEGKNRQIRRMGKALGYNVINLKRIRIMNIKLGNLKTGATRKIEGLELKEFLESLGLNFS